LIRDLLSMVCWRLLMLVLGAAQGCSERSIGCYVVGNGLPDESGLPPAGSSFRFFWYSIELGPTEDTAPSSSSVVVTDGCLAMVRVLSTCLPAVAAVKRYLPAVTKQQTAV
jgi:hypothetical protein